MNGDLLMFALEFLLKDRYTKVDELETTNINKCILYTQTMKELE